MSEELLDIVDENNELTGEVALRSRVHAEGMWHRTAHIYLFQKDGSKIEFLVHLRSKLKDLSPNTWDTRFGGHVKTGLTIQEGLNAELEEEIGLNASSYSLIEGEWRKRDNFPNCEFTKVYYLEYTGNIADLKFNDGEVQKVKWMNRDAIKTDMIERPAEWSGGVTGFTKVSDYLDNSL